MAEVTEVGLIPQSSRFFSQLWKAGYRFFEADGFRIQAIVPGGPNGWKSETIRFDVPEALPLQGDPAALLQDWTRKLGLKFDESRKIIPAWPVERLGFQPLGQDVLKEAEAIRQILGEPKIPLSR